MTSHPDDPSLVTLPRRFQTKMGDPVILRRVREEDAEQICAILPQAHRESDFLNWMPGEFDWTAEREREFIRDHVHRRGAIILCAESDDRIIALAGAHPMPFRRFTHHAEIGITVLKDHWGRGLGRTLVEFLVAWGRAEKLAKLTLRVFEDNHRAMGLYRALGFAEEGRLRGDALRADGRYSDTILMARFLDGA